MPEQGVLYFLSMFGLCSTIRRLRADKGARTRELLASRYLRGTGIEIGALNCPLQVPSSVTVRYVDRFGAQELHDKHYPEVALHEMVWVDVLDDGETLSTFASDSLDFVVANHFLEHCQDPIGTVETFLRVVRSGGVVFLAVPDKRHTFDHGRPVTPLDHLLRDYREGPAWSRRAHFEEFVRFVGQKTDEPFDVEVTRLLDLDYSIHFHVWTEAELRHLVTVLRDDLAFPFDLELFTQDVDECILVLKRT